METPIDTTNFSYKFTKYLFEKGLTEDDYFKCLNSLLEFGGVMTVAEYAKENNMSVQNVYQRKQVRTLIGRKVIFDND
tara:strand:+ start:379 stop:612 length:234 start_codon:yes stop_codon:yes gene_type:complete